MNDRTWSISLTDNSSCKLSILSELQSEDKETFLNGLHAIADIDISKLKNDSRFLLFANRDKIEDKHIFSIERSQDNNEYGIMTGNIAGFVGVNNVQISIMSRFAQGEKNDFFLHYMLSKVFNINLLNLKHGEEKGSLFDFLVFLFPFFLRRALKKGLFRAYISYECNDSNIKGQVNVPRYLKNDIPFMGKIAYDKREYSTDNNMTELVRHTIEFIRSGSFAGIIRDGDVSTDVKKVVEVTPAYDRAKRENVINRNLKPVKHPYYSEWTDLQKICLMILRHNKLNYAEAKDKIYGIVFDVSWLWEEYLNKVFLERGFSVIHPENKMERGGKNLLKHNNIERYPRYPDYYTSDNKRVLDAKYKRLKNKSSDDAGWRNDLHQIITYIFLFGAKRGIFLFPDVSSDPDVGTELIKEGILNNVDYPVSVEMCSLVIPQNAENYKSFEMMIKKNEECFVNCLRTG